jgi:hypothetical protein
MYLGSLVSLLLDVIGFVLVASATALSVGVSMRRGLRSAWAARSDFLI